MPSNKKMALNKGKVLVIINKPIEKIPENKTDMLQTMNNLHSFMNEIIIKNEKLH
jgi:hypothetical protein